MTDEQGRDGRLLSVELLQFYRGPHSALSTREVTMLLDHLDAQAEQIQRLLLTLEKLREYAGVIVHAYAPTSVIDGEHWHGMDAEARAALATGGEG